MTRCTCPAPPPPLTRKPGVSGGCPTLRGIGTWVLYMRARAGEDIEDVAIDYGLRASEVQLAVNFESRRTCWAHPRPGSWRERAVIAAESLGAWWRRIERRMQ